MNREKYFYGLILMQKMFFHHARHLSVLISEALHNLRQEAKRA